MRYIDKIIIHCAASKGDVSAATIREWHKGQGWSDIGYNYVIRRNGTLELGRDLDGDGDVWEEVGAHAKGFNSNSIGICLAGGYGGANDFTLAQWQTLEVLVRGLKQKFTKAGIFGHNDFTDAKTCPNFNVADWYDSLTTE